MGVAGGAVVQVGLHRTATNGEAGFNRGIARAVYGGSLEGGTAVNMARHAGRYLVAYDINYAANSIRAVDQSRRTAGNLNFFCCLWINRYRVICRLGGYITGAFAVLQNEHAFAAQTANDRPGGCGSDRKSVV